MTKRLSDVDSSTPPPKKQLSLSDMNERIPWIDKLISNEERHEADVEGTRKLDQAAKSAERKAALALAKKKKKESSQAPSRTRSSQATPNPRKRKKADSESKDDQEEGLQVEGPEKKRSRTNSKTQGPPPKSTHPNRTSQFIDFHGTQMSGMTFMMTPDLAKSGATLTLTLSYPSNPQ
jgi:hypothetical protein